MPRWRASASLAGVSTTRWPRTGTSSSSTSVGTTYSRPWSRAHPRAARSSARLPRTDAPTDVAVISRVARTSATIHSAIRGSRYTAATARSSTSISSTPTTGPSVARVQDALILDHLEPLRGGGIAERGTQEEAVQLGLGQRERPLVLDRVLRGQQQERSGDGLRRPVNGHLALGHRLEQRGLRLRGRPVDLVDQHHVREDRTRPELEVTRAGRRPRAR